MTPPTYAQEPTWTKPIMVSPDDTSISWFPEIVSDAAGNVHLFWTSGRSLPEQNYGYDTVVYCQPAEDNCHNRVEIAARSQEEGGIYATRPSAVVDADGHMHLLYRHGGMIAYTQTRVDQIFSALAWSRPYRISGDGTAYYSDIAIDSQGIIHIVWSQSVSADPTVDITTLPCAECADIFYRRSEDGGYTWSAPVDISNSEIGSEKPQIVFGENQDIYVVWVEGYDFVTGKGEATSTTVGVSHDGGVTWSAPVNFLFPHDAPQRVTAGLDHLGQLVVVWGLSDGDGIYYQLSRDQGRSWSPPQPIKGVAIRAAESEELDNYHMQADAAGHLHLVLAGRDAELAANTEIAAKVPRNVYHLEWDGKNWSEPEIIYSNPNTVPEWPRIAVVNGNELHVTWFVRSGVEQAKTNFHRIWYSKGQSQAPAQPPEVWQWPTPTVTPTPEATPTPQPTLTPTATPIIEKLNEVEASPEAVGTIFTDYDEIFLLLKSLAPALLVVVMILIGTRIFRRN